MAVFLLAYGVARQTLLEPNTPFKWNSVAEIFFVPYFQVYGELFIEKDLLFSGEHIPIFIRIFLMSSAFPYLFLHKRDIIIEYSRHYHNCLFLSHIIVWGLVLSLHTSPYGNNLKES